MQSKHVHTWLPHSAKLSCFQSSHPIPAWGPLTFGYFLEKYRITRIHRMSPTAGPLRMSEANFPVCTMPQEATTEKRSEEAFQVDKQWEVGYPCPTCSIFLSVFPHWLGSAKSHPSCCPPSMASLPPWIRMDQYEIHSSGLNAMEPPEHE